MKYTAVVSAEAEAVSRLLSGRYDVIRLIPDPTLQQPVASHPDMLLCKIGNKLFVHREYLELNSKTISEITDRCKLEQISVDCERREEYPFDIALNVLICGNNAFSLKKHTSLEIVSQLSSDGYSHFNIKQGYSACSTLSLENAVVTADVSVAKACSGCGIDTLLISHGGIALPGYDCGFIGGASGVCEKTVYFAGELESHPDAKNIREFLFSHGYTYESLIEGELVDIGGIKFFRNYL